MGLLEKAVFNKIATRLLYITFPFPAFLVDGNGAVFTFKAVSFNLGAD